LNEKYKEKASKVDFFIGDIRDYDRLKFAFQDVDVVINAAALKHVPACEYNPLEAIKTNINGTVNVCNCAIETGVKKVIHLSTDKAVEPINLYGASKMAAEKYAIFSNCYSKTINADEKLTKISCVRYGNVIGSRGSIIDVFKNMSQMEHMEITDLEMTRFWMHLDESVKMVLWSIDNAVGGEIVLPLLGSSKIIDVAKLLLKDKPVKIIGVREGEKLHEQLLNRREAERTYLVGGYYVILPESHEWSSRKIQQHYEQIGTKIPNNFSYYSNNLDLLMSQSELKEYFGL
jgi:UDP-N-acetylglucosamine 4,6-dehydratase